MLLLTFLRAPRSDPKRRTKGKAHNAQEKEAERLMRENMSVSMLVKQRLQFVAHPGSTHGEAQARILLWVKVEISKREREREREMGTHTHTHARASKDLGSVKQGNGAQRKNVGKKKRKGTLA